MSSKKKQAEIQEEKDWQKIDEAVVSSERFIEKYQKQILIGIGALVVIMSGILAYNHFIIGPKTEEAQGAMFRAEQYFQAGEDSLAIFGDQNGHMGFEAIMDEYGSTRPGKLAKLYAGICYARMDQYDKALEYLKGYSGSDKVISHLVYGSIGDCLDNQGKTEEAASYYIKAAKGVDNESQSPVLYKKAGLIYRDLGQYDKVIEVFTIIKDRYMKNGQTAMDAEKYIEEANIMKGNK